MKLTQLLTIDEAQLLHQLSEEQLKELQTALSRLGYPVGDIDGLIGPKTRNAWAEFKTDIFQGNPDLIASGSIGKLQSELDELDKASHYDFSTKEGTIEAIKNQCKIFGIGLNSQIAYVLATTEWETAQTFRPVKEAYWLSEEWRARKLKYYPYYGRGFVQLTWKNNYEQYSKILGIDLVHNPDKSMEPSIALFILVHGFKSGVFTGRKITEYIDENKADFVKARRCINGRDHAHDIAQLTEKYLRTV